MFKRSTSFHEAGHAVAHLSFGHGFSFAEVCPDGAGRCHAELFREPYYHDDVAALLTADPRWTRDAVIERGMQEIVACFAGPFAEARYRHRDICDVLENGGSKDEKQAHDLLCFLARDKDEYSALRLECEIRARKLVNAHWPLIVAVAGVLAREGEIGGEHTLFDPLYANAAPRQRYVSGK